ncbi:NUDIX hydrolase [Micromonospora zhanjiangensis]|uniref:NUDIX hydrolase n=1 Tax=Micromonospora zhanjiangensis TaxID=1522057 RepID=A0ABV8KGQ9_9ACTN
MSVAAVVIDEDSRVLVIQRRDNGAWQIPGGVLELEEKIEDGVRREVAEETGISVEPERLTGIYKNMKLGVVALVFRARLVHGVPQPTEESAAVDWWTKERVAAEMNETFAVRVLDAMNSGLVPTVRHHDGTQLTSRSS